MASPSYRAHVHIRVLGPVEVLRDGSPVPLGARKLRTALALLAAAVGRTVSVEALIDGVWGDDPTPGARSTLQTYVSSLRHELGAAIVHENGGYRLDLDPRLVDAVEFETVVVSARDLVTSDPAEASQRLRAALALWRGRPYADLAPSFALEVEAGRLEELRLEALELRIEAELQMGYHGQLATELEVLCAEHPDRERFRAQHMLALYRAGRQGDALGAFQATRAYLAEELGLEPSQELRELERRILNHDPSLELDIEPLEVDYEALLSRWRRVGGSPERSSTAAGAGGERARRRHGAVAAVAALVAVATLLGALAMVVRSPTPSLGSFPSTQLHCWSSVTAGFETVGLIAPSSRVDDFCADAAARGFLDDRKISDEEFGALMGKTRTPWLWGNIDHWDLFRPWCQSVMTPWAQALPSLVWTSYSDPQLWAEEACTGAIAHGHFTLEGLEPSALARLLRDDRRGGYVAAPFVTRAILELHAASSRQFPRATDRTLVWRVWEEVAPRMQASALALTCLDRPACYALERSPAYERTLREAYGEIVRDGLGLSR
jgi:DNA-binding SARP family transcriptional activator